MSEGMRAGMPRAASREDASSDSESDPIDLNRIKTWRSRTYAMLKPTAEAMPISVLTNRDTQNAIMDAMKSASDVFQK